MRILKISIIMLLSVNSALADLKVGAWKTSITPTTEEFSELCMGGYGAPYSRCGVTETLDPITVRSMTITDDDKTLSFAVIDTVGVGDSLIAAIKERAEEISHGYIDGEDIYIAATHTHAGPDLQGLWGGVSEAYRERVIDSTAQALFLAKLVARPAILQASTTTVPVRNRRGLDVIDDSLTVLSFKGKYFNLPIATIVNMSAHPTILDETNLAYSSGYIHSARKFLERRQGGVSLFFNGILGDAEPDVEGADIDTARSFGRSVGRQAWRALANAELITGDFNVSSTQFSHPVSNPGIIYAAQIGLLDLALDPDNLSVSSAVTAFSFGDQVSAITFPGEALTGTGLELKTSMETSYKLVFGVTGASHGYFMPVEEYLSIDGRFTEEQACIDPLAGDSFIDQTSVLF